MSRDNISFDAKYYLSAYPDVAQSGLEPRDHYERYWRILGRSPVHTEEMGVTGTEMSPAELDRAYAQGPLQGSGRQDHDDLVSIIMPSYNNAEWIARSIHSVLSQSSVNVELIVVDDGSTDHSVSVARAIAADHPNVRVISLLRNFGCYYARNIGVTRARGTYVTIVDSDDIITPDRILRQLNALKAHPEKKACLARTRRWSEDMSTPLGDLRYAENTLLWKRSLIDEIGYYDTVRFGGDTEFRVRIETLFGKAAVLRIPDEVYFLRTLETSLTTATGSTAYASQNGVLRPSLSDDRKRYSDNLNTWVQTAAANMMSGGLPLVEFPQLERPFELGDPSQNASPSLGQRRVGAMASFPLRIDSLKATIASILPQLDLLILYLNDYDEVPDFARHPKIRAIRSQDAVGDLRDNGKFYDLPQDDSSYVFTFDDDLLYPPDYTSRLIHQIELLGRSCIVGSHGVIFPYDEFTKLSQRTVFHFLHRSRGRFVDMLGTGTTAWHSSTIKPTLADFSTKGVCDLWFAALSMRKGIPMYSVPRRRAWVNEFAKYEVSLWQEASERPEGYFEIYHRSVKPVLARGGVRRAAEAHMIKSFPADVLMAAEVELREATAAALPQLPAMTRHIALHGSPYEYMGSTEDCPHFHLVLSGHDSRKVMDKTLRAVAEQKFGPFTFAVTMVDDGSSDGSFAKLAAMSILPEGRLLGVTTRTGAAYGRDLAIREICTRNAFVIPLTFGEVLAPGALADLSRQLMARPALDVVMIARDGNKRVLAFRRSRYDLAVDMLQDELGHWTDDSDLVRLTQHITRKLARGRIATLEGQYLDTPHFEQISL
ncbi:glycosyltransferase family 2 protein [Gemmobacter serpentinus]|uniref:glycosyltransferase family 2 protein n=1 Tax=Gemmobacter serpentinus TaxID=2652247 RepID=UPI00124D813F|nr:glycosyltransferase family A protein [Gemmobacter serpentinus]